IQGGEIGSGHSLMAIVEIEPMELEIESTTRLSPFGKLWMHYQLPGKDDKKTEEFAIPYLFLPFEDLPDYYRFSASVALFGDLLKKSVYTRKSSWDELALIAKSSYDPKDVSQNEYVLLIDKAKRIYHKDKKKKKPVTPE